ncbi:MAG: hypothetical protein HY278_03470, partial [candidate division NC10 bacterium]|nr:hypothetical protein [candidate division NC10 bacterium]
MMKLHEGVNSEMTVLGRLLKVYEDLLALRRQYLNRLGVIKIANRLFATLDSSKGKPTFEEWAALHRTPRTWKPTWFGERREFVWESGGWLVASAALVSGARSQYLGLLLHPDHERRADEVLAFVMAHASERSPLYASARDYQP